MHRRSFLKVASLVAPLQLAGCATRGSAPDGVPVKPGDGLLAFKISSTVYAKMNYARYEASPTALGMFLTPRRTFAVERGEAYFVNPLEAGDYMWSEFIIGMGVQVNLSGSNRFVVSPGVITYIGHLSLSLFDRRTSFFSNDRGVVFSAADQEPDMLAHLKTHFPKYISAMPVRKEIAEVRVAG